MKGRDAGDLLRGVPGAVGLGDGECLLEGAAGGVAAGVEAAAGCAVPWGGTGQGEARGSHTGAEGGDAGDLLRGVPGAVGLGDGEYTVAPAIVIRILSASSA